jgi:hypothetical protein
MNGFWRCRCGLETEVTVDGKIIDLRQYNTEPLEQRASEPQLSSDDEFLKTCGIAVETNEP